MPETARLQRLAALLAIGAGMLLARPYEGIRHDGVLYLGQALLHSRVPALIQDTFFAGGSQDRYSIYAAVIAPLYDRLGLVATHVGILLTDWLLMLSAVLALLRRFEPRGPLSLWGALAFAVVSPIYGGTTVIGYGEPFLTARSFAEPALLWGLVALIDGRTWAAAALAGLAAAFHPLMALPVMVVGWCFLLQSNRRWLWLLAVVPLVVLAALAGLRPWDGLLKTYDPYWWAMVQDRNPMVMLSGWTLDELLRVLLDIAVLLAVSRLRPADAWTRLLHAVVTATVGLMGLTALGTDGFHSVLVTQLQLWRVHWIAHLIAVALTPWLAVRLWRLGGLWPLSACALLLAIVNAHIGLDEGVVTLSLWAASSVAAWRLRAPSCSVRRFAIGGVVLAIAGLSVARLTDQLGEVAWQTPETFWNDGLARVAAFPSIAVIGFACLLFLSSKGRRGAFMALGLSVLLFGAAVASWDQRTDLARAIESPAASAHPFASYMPSDATVYWPHQLAPVWGLLERPSHFATQQGAGLLFNRGTAVIFGSRNEVYQPIRTTRDSCRAASLLVKDRASRRGCEMPERERLVTVCSRRDRPDYLVLPQRLREAPLAVWAPPRHREPAQEFALYSCAQLIAGP